MTLSASSADVVTGKCEKEVALLTMRFLLGEDDGSEISPRMLVDRLRSTASALLNAPIRYASFVVHDSVVMSPPDTTPALLNSTPIEY